MCRGQVQDDGRFSGLHLVWTGQVLDRDSIAERDCVHELPSENQRAGRQRQSCALHV